MMIEQLKNIPHLQLDIEIDIDKLVNDWKNHVCDDQFSQNTEYHVGIEKRWGLNLDLLGIIDYNKDPLFTNLAMYHLHGYEELMKTTIETLPTTIGDKTTYITDLIYRIGEHPDRCRFSKLKANNNVPIHKHNQKEYKHFVIHVPIKTNDGVVFGVKRNSNEYRQNYKLGTAWLLNTWDEHFVLNTSNEDRHHLFLNYYMVSNTKLYESTKKALEKYDGPVMT